QQLIQDGPVGNLKEPFVSFRVSDQSISKAKKKEQATFALKVISEEWEKIGHPDYSDVDLQERLRGWYLQLPDRIHKRDLKLCRVYTQLMRLFVERQQPVSEEWGRVCRQWCGYLQSQLKFKPFCQQLEYYKVWQEYLKLYWAFGLKH
ncbi:MAG: hypothetical protein AAF571_03245, partial [Verrucomicrobiota bacterium]